MTGALVLYDDSNDRSCTNRYRRGRAAWDSGCQQNSFGRSVVGPKHFLSILSAAQTSSLLVHRLVYLPMIFRLGPDFIDTYLQSIH